MYSIRISGTVTELPEGVVFLPTAGERCGSSIEGVDDYGVYWSSSATDEHDAYFVFLFSEYVGPDYSDLRIYGSSVRLVTDCE